MPRDDFESIWYTFDEEDIYGIIGSLFFGYGLIYFLKPEHLLNNLGYIDKIIQSIAIGVLILLLCAFSLGLYTGLTGTSERKRQELTENWIKKVSIGMVFLGTLLIVLQLLGI